ncbi:MAG: tyrosinase family protein [Bacteroidota bacterium]
MKKHCSPLKRFALFFLFVFLLNNILLAGIRPDLNDEVPEEDWPILAAKITEYMCASQSPYGVPPYLHHANELNEGHSLPGTPSTLTENCNGDDINVYFLDWHRAFIKNLEDWLIDEGLPRFVPLPAWDPCKEVPAPFLDQSSACPGFFPPENATINCGFFGSDKYDCDNLCSFDSFCDFTDQLETNHGGPHNFLGGSMPNPPDAAATAIFYVYHAYIDDIYQDWLITNPDYASDPTFPDNATNVSVEEPVIEIISANCFSVEARVKSFGCLETVSWFGSGLSVLSQSFSDGYHYVTLCGTQTDPPPSYTINASLSIGCNSSTISKTITNPSCDIEIAKEDCGWVLVRYLMPPNSGITSYEWTTEAPSFIGNSGVRGDYINAMIVANQAGVYTVTLTIMTPCGETTMDLDLHIDLSPPFLPPFTEIHLCGTGPSNEICYDLALYNDLTDLIVNGHSANLHVDQNGTEICLYSYQSTPGFGSITLTPIGPCGEGATVTWNIPLNNPFLCGDFGGIGLIGQNTDGNQSFSDVNIYPNPFNDRIEIKFGKGVGDRITIEVFNSLGNSVSNYSGQTSVVHTEDLAPGLYYIRILNEENEILHFETLIKQ